MKQLKLDSIIWQVLSLRKNMFQTFDGLIKLQWPTLEGIFYDKGDFSDRNMARLTVPGMERIIFMFDITLMPQQQEHSREVYNLLDLMGDLGGVLEVFIFACGIILFPISEHSFVIKALQILFLARTRDKHMFEVNKKQFKKNMKKKNKS